MEGLEDIRVHDIEGRMIDEYYSGAQAFPR